MIGRSSLWAWTYTGSFRRMSAVQYCSKVGRRLEKEDKRIRG
jgi:hypothetical protein